MLIVIHNTVLRVHGQFTQLKMGRVVQLTYKNSLPFYIRFTEIASARPEACHGHPFGLFPGRSIFSR